MVLSAGTVVGGYRIEKVLGSGGMGTVYLAANPVLPRRDALKVLSSELSRDRSFRARFIREADLAATLDHPNIVTVYTRGETPDGQLWIAMQYVAGTDADNEMEQGRMTPQRAVYVTGEVAKALDYAHRRNLVHRDVKPANFLLASDDDERVFLADFGIARALDDGGGLTATGMVVASVAYASPEMLGTGTVDGRTDIYSLGCSLYRMLTGRAPFAGAGTLAATMAAHLSKPPPRVTDVVPDLPRGIDAVIARAMAKDPAARYQSAREFAAAAVAALHEPAGPGPSPPWPAEPPPPQPPASDLVTYPSGYFSGPHPGPPRPAEPVPPQYRTPAPPVPGAGPSTPVPARRSRWRGPRRMALLAAAAVVLVAAGTIGVLTHRGDTGPQHAYQPQAFRHLHGTTEITSEPHAVAALGPGDADAVLSLGVQPVAISAPVRLPGWEQRLITGNPKLLAGVDPTALTGVRPDVIIATGDIDDATYDKLAAIAPTVTRPQDHPGPGWAWQDQLTWIGRILGRDDRARQLLDASHKTQDGLRDQHPAFGGKSIAVVDFSDTGITAALAPSNASGYLEGLGFRYSETLNRGSGETGDDRPVDDLTQFFSTPTDALVVLRTDKNAAGGYNGLPAPFTAYRGGMVIIDTPDVIAALHTGGYAATEYLDSTLVGSLAQQFH